MHSLRMTPVTAKSYLTLTCVSVSVNPAGRTMMVTGWHRWHADPITANVRDLISTDIGWLCSDPFQPSLLGECAVGHSGIWQGGGSMCEKAGVNISRYLMLGLERVTTMTSHQWNIFWLASRKKKAGIMLPPLHTMDKWKLGLCFLIKCFFHFIWLIN